MIHVNLATSADGCLSKLVMAGHSGREFGSAGENLVCAAVTGLVRSFADALVNQRGIQVTGNADVEGRFQVAVAQVDPPDRDWLRGATAVLKAGLGRLQNEAPTALEFRLSEREE